MKNAYELTVDYSEKNGAHTIVEKWLCKGLKRLGKAAASALDTALDDDGMPGAPDMDRLRKSLGRYALEKDIEAEYRRMKKAYDTYAKLVAGVSPSRTALTLRLDSRTTVTLRLLEGEARA